jgi:ABC-type sugar transport system substrate-binding protein
MKGLKKLVATVAAGAALLALVPASASAAAYTHYVACGVSQNAKPAHLCQKARKKGAFFKSNSATVFYTVCVKFPTKKNLCAEKQEAVQGTLYVNKITSNIPGKHVVSWFVEGQKVGSFAFTVPD